MDATPQFRIRYWGVTGTLARTLPPGELIDKIAGAVAHLLQTRKLEELAPLVADLPALRKRLDTILPRRFHSTPRGNSTCVGIETPDELIVLDCGSGIRDLGYLLEDHWNAPGYAGSRKAHVILTHPHIDHIIGIPFVEAFYDPKNDFSFWAPQSVLDGLDAVFSEGSQMSRIYVPTAYREMVGVKSLHPIAPGSGFAIGGTRFSTFALNHPGGSLGYRLDRGERSVVLATDHEHTAAPDLALADFARGADLLYADAQYLPEEYRGEVGISGARPVPHRGWGHSTVDDVVATALAAGVKLLHLGHHEPRRSDDDFEALEQRARELVAAGLARGGREANSCRVELAQEDMTIEI
jgi:phosphoribosyl 1,2-cyclic phosphodiesterase